MNPAEPAFDDFEWTCPAWLEALAQCEVLWRHYRETAVHFTGPDCFGVVRPVDFGTGENDPPLGALHVITAIQPESDPDSEESVARMGAFDNELRNAGLRALPVVGVSVDGSHREDSRAVFGLDDERARALGRRFGQVAVFAWHGAKWSLLACAADRQTRRGWL